MGGTLLNWMCTKTQYIRIYSIWMCYDFVPCTLTELVLLLDKYDIHYLSEKAGVHKLWN